MTLCVHKMEEKLRLNKEQLTKMNNEAIIIISRLFPAQLQIVIKVQAEENHLDPLIADSSLSLLAQSRLTQ